VAVVCHDVANGQLTANDCAYSLTGAAAAAGCSGSGGRYYLSLSG